MEPLNRVELLEKRYAAQLKKLYLTGKSKTWVLHSWSQCGSTNHRFPVA